MKMINMKCPSCGANLSFEDGSSEVTCEFCGSKLHLEDNSLKLKLDGAEHAGYQFEKGRQRAQQESGEGLVTPSPSPENKKGGIIKILLWLFFFPFMLLYTVWKANNLSTKAKGIITGIVCFCLLLVASSDSLKRMTTKKKVEIPANEVYFSGMFSETFEPAGKSAKLTMSNSLEEATLKMKINCVQTPEEYLRGLFVENGEDFDSYKLEYVLFEIADCYLYIGDSDAETIRNKQTLERLLNMGKGEHDFECTFNISNNEAKNISEMTQLLLGLELKFKNINQESEHFGREIRIPWSVKDPEVVKEEPTPEPTMTPEPTTESTTKVEEPAQNSTSFREYLDNYETFIDSYIAFMNSYDSNNPTALVEYAKFMKEYYDYVSSIESIDTDNLTEEDYTYYIEVTNRVNYKLVNNLQ